MKQLETIFLWGNPITEIPIEVASFQNLKVLYIPRIELNTEKFAEFLTACPKQIHITTNENLAENTGNSYVLITVSKIKEEWKALKNVTIVE